jgi:hypothetical protein
LIFAHCGVLLAHVRQFQSSLFSRKLISQASQRESFVAVLENEIGWLALV